MYNYKFIMKYENTEGNLVEDDLIISHENKFTKEEFKNMIIEAINNIEIYSVHELKDDIIPYMILHYGFRNLPIEAGYKLYIE